MQVITLLKSHLSSKLLETVYLIYCYNYNVIRKWSSYTVYTDSMFRHFKYKDENIVHISLKGPDVP